MREDWRRRREEEEGIGNDRGRGGIEQRIGMRRKVRKRRRRGREESIV